ncbi:nucleobase-ascorbate transporter 5-like [Chenopodium quinoa]|uniref:nucleobase-ascorbate transporter 5-like n=1 Tax=Chenopodium quinoa TaxID=63459 RepID=UPI000B78160B|nr:nucleobase-ascorbate transporter 5-like [Chenopodium quinoa]
MGGNNHDKAEVIQSMMFVSSISTLLQTLVGTRLPVGASHTFVIPMKTIVLSMSLLCIDQPQPPEKTFANTMARMQGALLVASVIQIILGFSGLWRLFVRSLSPLSMVPLITFTGLGLFSFGFPRVILCPSHLIHESLRYRNTYKIMFIWRIMSKFIFSTVQFCVLMDNYLFSWQIVVNICIWHLQFKTLLLSINYAMFWVFFGQQYVSTFLKTNRQIFDRYAIIFSTAIIWVYALILTLSGVYNNKPPATQLSCRTDRAGLIHEADWVYLPRPFQWGKPIVNLREATPIIFAGLVALVESTGTFIAAARYASATPVPPSVISRGTFWLGIGTLLNGVCGAVTGPTASVESAGLLGLTRVGSRRVIQISTGFMLIFSIFGKLAAFFASVPYPIMAATYCILYAYVSSAGLNHLQFCNLNSFRTLFILGFAFFMAISVPQHFRDYLPTSNSSPICFGVF